MRLTRRARAVVSVPARALCSRSSGKKARREEWYRRFQHVAGLVLSERSEKALQRHQPSRAVLRRHVPLGGRVADFVLDDGETLLAVEVKFTKQPLGAEDVQQARLELEYLHAQVSQHAEMLVVSCSGFRRQAIEAAARSPALLLVTWSDRDDDEQLAAALAAVFTQESGG